MPNTSGPNTHGPNTSGPTVSTVVIGAGHCGLAMSRCLADRSIDHVVLERGEVAHTWRTERWDSLRLLTPNWMTRLPGFAYDGDDPDGYMTVPEVVDLLGEYAKSAPVQAHTSVTSVRPGGAGGYTVQTGQGSYTAESVVVATGACNEVVRPPFHEAIPASITQLTTKDYRRPGQLPEGGVLVVGAAASGIQIAEEIHRSGRPVTLAVGEHVRLPRTYRGADILWWMNAAGVLEEGYAEVPDLARARSLPSMQLIGSDSKVTLGLNELTDLGVRLVGRLAGVSDGRAQLSGGLANVCALADLKLRRLLTTIDAWAEAAGIAADEPPERPEPTRVPAGPPLFLDLRSGEISAIVWATGYRADVSWLDVPVLDRKGRIAHHEGVTAAPGLYVLGMPFLRQRRSTFIIGGGADAAVLAEHLAGHLRSAR